PHVIDTRFRWPDTGYMLLDYYGAQSRRPVLIQGPKGAKRHVLYFVDPRRCRVGAGNNTLAEFKKANAPGEIPGPPAPVPQLIRCPWLPGRADFKRPDGRCVDTLADGSVTTSWWKDSKLHRDPEEGPAVLSNRMDGFEVCAEEYWVHGKRHRP